MSKHWLVGLCTGFILFAGCWEQCASQQSNGTTIKPSHVMVKLSDSNGTCISVDGILEFNIPYETTSGYIKTASIVVPPNLTNITGSCSMGYQALSISWGTQNTLTFGFVGNGLWNPSPSGGTYKLQTIYGTVVSNPEDFPDALNPGKIYYLSAKDVGIISAPLNQTFVCQSTQYAYFEKEGASLKISELQAEAFHKGEMMSLVNATDTDTDTGVETTVCTKDSLNLIVGLTAVGVVVVLITLAAASWLYRRRRTGYADI